MSDKIDFWLVSAENDWEVAGHLFEKGDYSYSLFFGHLTLEKMLKAYFVQTQGGTPPLTHRLVFLAMKSGLVLSVEQQEMLESVTDFNLEARYPDEKFSFKKRCTHEFTRQYLDDIKEMKEWLAKKIL